MLEAVNRTGNKFLIKPSKCHPCDGSMLDEKQYNINNFVAQTFHVIYFSPIPYFGLAKVHVVGATKVRILGMPTESRTQATKIQE